MDPARSALREWYISTFAPLFLPDARPRTLEAYAGTVAVWERATPNPPLADVDQVAAAKFRTMCPGRASTVGKHCRHLNAMFAKLGPPGPRNRDALGLLPRVPGAGATASDAAVRFEATGARPGTAGRDASDRDA